MQKKSLCLCIGAILFLLIGCGKKTIAEKPLAKAALAGTWELRESQNGMMPTMQHAPGNGSRFRFTETAYEQYQNGNQVKSGSYEVVRDTTAQTEVGLDLPAGQFTNRLVLANDPSATKIFFEIEGNKLTLLSGFFPTDGGSRQIFEKTDSGK
ncbi:hypothetical protein [Flavisolibacter nicotianae]|uniref:hypothetical protein n=1 Tax=Flavisolibacter nicotianae TaxID=2364882 RepID=UPI000EB12E52|nr:hypothetical protein [Flavisolibacter nicotianae]